MNLSKFNMKKILKFGINLFPAKNYSFAFTLHNLSPTDYLWFEKTLDLLSKEFEFIDPNNLEDLLNQNFYGKIYALLLRPNNSIL